MSAPSETPETDAEFDRLRFVVEPNAYQGIRDQVMFGMRDLGRKLELERNEEKLHAANLQALLGLRDDIRIELRARVAELEKDKERLDWFDQYLTGNHGEKYWKVWQDHHGHDLRKAIDAAMKGRR